MSADTPPKPYFSGINFNPSFFSPIIQYLTEAIANTKYLMLNGLNFMTGNLGIKRIAEVELDVDGKAIINNGVGSLPANGRLGSNGTRLILFPGTATEPPFALGYNGETLWYGTHSSGNHRFYTGTNERLIIKSDGNVGIGTTNPDSKLHIMTQDNTALTTNLLNFKNESDYGIYATSTTIGNRGNTLNFYSRDYNNGTGISTRPIISLRPEGNVGIGTDNPGTYKVRIKGPINNTFLRIETSQDLVGELAGIHLGIPGYNEATCAKVLTKVFDSFTNNLEFHTANGNNTSSAKMVIGGDGNVGIGTSTPLARLHLHNTGNNQEVKLSLTDNSTGAAVTDGCAIMKTDVNDLFIINYEATRLIFFTANNVRMQISGSGNVGIGGVAANNILQVGDGGRLRISNGTTDYTLIGSKETDDAANTSIEIYGNTHSTFAGKIYYFATTATGDHTFYTNGSTTLANTLANFSPTKNTFYKNVRAVNYENEGVLYPHTTLTNSGGSSLSGYFIPVNDYTNSFMTCAFSHDSTSYTYWRGHVFIGNNNQILGVSAPLLGSNLLVESFIQQTTLLQFIRVIPTVSYSSSVQLRVKIYG
jgi:hypothetical protein